MVDIVLGGCGGRLVVWLELVVVVVVKPATVQWDHPDHFVPRPIE